MEAPSPLRARGGGGRGTGSSGRRRLGRSARGDPDPGRRCRNAAGQRCSRAASWCEKFPVPVVEGLALRLDRRRGGLWILRTGRQAPLDPAVYVAGNAAETRPRCPSRLREQDGRTRLAAPTPRLLFRAAAAARCGGGGGGLARVARAGSPATRSWTPAHAICCPSPGTPCGLAASATLLLQPRP